MVRRITTNGMMQSYRSNLMRSYNTLASVSEKVTTQRQFNSYAESPARAGQAFQLRRNRWNTESQISNSKEVTHKFQQAWDCLQATHQDLGHKLGTYSALRADNGATAGGRFALGEVLKGTANSIMQTMNAKYGENYIFSGADGENVPFSWGPNGEVMFRGMAVDDVANDADFQKMITDEHTFVDLGMGMQEDNSGQLIDASAFDTALQGIDFIGYGMTAEVTLSDGVTKVQNVPNNLASILQEMGEIYANCDQESGNFASVDDQHRAEALEIQLRDKLNNLHSGFVELDTRATYLKSNEERLTSLDDSLNTQITSLEDVDPADAITALMWGQYSYNAALRIGTSILSQSLIDYMR